MKKVGSFVIHDVYVKIQEIANGRYWLTFSNGLTSQYIKTTNIMTIKSIAMTYIESNGKRWLA